MTILDNSVVKVDILKNIGPHGKIVYSKNIYFYDKYELEERQYLYDFINKLPMEEIEFLDETKIEIIIKTGVTKKE
jgi:hypothetical protein